MKIHNFAQGTLEWINIRLGKFTATNAQAVATAKKGLDTACYEKVAEIMTKKPAKEFFMNDDMYRGEELEDKARSEYSIETKHKVIEVGFCELDKWCGCSPDGLVNDDGLVEIKCQDAKNYVKTMATRKPASVYMWQMQYQMFVTGRKYCDFVVFNEKFEKIIRININRNEEKIRKIKAGLEIGINKVEKLLEEVK